MGNLHPAQLVSFTKVDVLVQSLSVQQQQSGNEELFEYNNQLRQGIFEAYSGILNGLSREKASHFLLAPSVVRFNCVVPISMCSDTCACQR